jgi:hypothetical protein
LNLIKESFDGFCTHEIKNSFKDEINSFFIFNR